MKKSIYFVVSLVVLSTAIYSAAPLWAAEFGQQSFRINSSPNIVGSGARALGVGGAFIAIADDATAASWNPAALIILKRPEAALMLSYEQRERFGTASFADFNYIAISYPFNFLRRNMIVSFNYQRLLDFNSDYNKHFLDDEHTIAEIVEYDAGLSPNGHYYISKNDTLRHSAINVSKEVTGDIGAIAPAYAIQITPKISFGFTLNFWMDGLVNDGYSSVYKEKQESFVRLDTYFYEDLNDDGHAQDDEYLGEEPGDPDQVIEGRLTYKSDYKFSGFNANIGLLLAITRHLTVGTVYKAPFTATVDFKQRGVNSQRRFDGTEWINNRDTRKLDFRYKMSFPAVYGLGLAWRFNDNFTMALDGSYTPWEDFVIQEYVKKGKVEPTGFGTGGNLYHATSRTSGVNGLSAKYADIDGVVTGRLGAEYLIIKPKTVIPVRMGLVYDPEPAQGHPDDFYAVTGGTGVMLFNRLLIDLAYEYRWSQSATVVTVANGATGDLLYEVHKPVTQHIVLLSTILHF